MRGNVDAKITGNTVTGNGPVDYIAQNGIVVSTGASALVEGNIVSGNSYTARPTWCPSGILVIDATGMQDRSRTRCPAMRPTSATRLAAAARPASRTKAAGIAARNP